MVRHRHSNVQHGGDGRARAPLAMPVVLPRSWWLAARNERASRGKLNLVTLSPLEGDLREGKGVFFVFG